MNYRTVHLLAETTITGSGTEIININVKDVISRIMICLRTTKVAAGMSAALYKDITKIELVDGSDVLHSMDGGENQALIIYDRKVGNINLGQIMMTSSCRSYYGIDFGRFLFDPVLGFDPTKFRNPQLKISYDVNVSDTSAETAYLEVWAELFDEKVVSPVGFLMSKEHYNAVSPSSGYRYIDLPTDYPYRQMLVQGYYLAFEPWYTVDQARLDEDNEKRIPFDWDMGNYQRVMRNVWTPIQEDFDAHATDDGITYYLTPTNYWVKAFGTATALNPEMWHTQPARGGKVVFYTATDIQEVHGIVRGWLPNHCFQFPFGDQMDLDDWYDVTRVGSLRLRLKSGTGGGTGTMAVVLQQLRKY